MSGLSNSQLINKAAITSGSFTGAVGLSVDEANTFIDYVVDQSALKNNARVVRMNAATVKIDKIGLGKRILRPAVAVTDPGETVDVSPSQITLAAKEIIAVARVSDDSLEDNIEGDAFVDHLMRMIAAQAGNELEEAFLLGRGGVAAGAATHIDQLWTGWYAAARNGGNVVDASAIGTDRFISFKKLSRSLKAMPTQFRTNPANLRMVVASDIEVDYTDLIAGRQSATGDAAIAGNGPMRYGQVSLVSIPRLPIDQPVLKAGGLSSTLTAAAAAGATTVTVAATTNLAVGDQVAIGRNTAFEEVRTVTAINTLTLTLNAALERNHANGQAVEEVTADGTFGLMTDYRNLVVGIQRDIRVETDRLPRLRATDFVLTMRADVAVENPAAVVLLEKLAVNNS